MKRFDVVTLFPEMFAALTQNGITGRAEDRGVYDLVCWNPREFATDPRKTIDDRPYGGGAGMVMMPAPLVNAIDAAKKRQLGSGVKASKTIYLSPQGRVLTQQLVEEMTSFDGLVLLSGRYEGVDERLIEAEVDEELSIGDYVLSGGELAAMVVVDAVTRQLPGVLGHELSAQEDSYVDGLLDCPHYTRPEEYQGKLVPEVLLSGNHELIRRWRLKQALGRTQERRPDMLQSRSMTAEENELLAEYLRERS